jgi:hypothetical protein
MTGAYRVPDEKTMRTVLDQLTPRALSRAGPGGPATGSARTGHPRVPCATTGPCDGRRR